MPGTLPDVSFTLFSLNMQTDTQDRQRESMTVILNNILNCFWSVKGALCQTAGGRVSSQGCRILILSDEPIPYIMNIYLPLVVPFPRLQELLQTVSRRALPAKEKTNPTFLSAQENVNKCYSCADAKPVSGCRLVNFRLCI